MMARPALGLWPAALLLVACSATPPNPAARPQPAAVEPGGPRRLTIAYQANLLGEIEPCG
jgi:hypothetical protein